MQCSQENQAQLSAAGAALVPEWTALRRRWRAAGAWRDWKTEWRAPLERLADPALMLLAGENAERLREEVQYLARRLAKQKAPLELVLAGIDGVHEVTGPGCARLGVEVATVAERFYQNLARSVAGGYEQVHRASLETLLAVLDAELAAGGLDELLPRLLELCAAAFGAAWAEVLLWEETGNGVRRLGSRAGRGVAADEAGAGGSAARLAERLLACRQPVVLHGAAADPAAAGSWVEARGVESLWCVPLGLRGPGDAVPGAVCIGFPRRYECLPQERDLLIALAERSTLAIERTRMTESLRWNERRIGELSRQLLAAQEEERRHISRELHDETGQAFMVLRLYLEMALRQPLPGVARASLERGLQVVDESIGGLRRIMSRLSPLVLDELGLAPALRHQLRLLRQSAGLASRLRVWPAQFRLSRELEVLVFRVAQEGLNNVVRHARASQVEVSLRLSQGRLRLRIADDGHGFTEAREGEPHFGLAGMRERLRLVGGSLDVSSRKGQGTLLKIEIPLPAAPARVMPLRQAAGA